MLRTFHKYCKHLERTAKPKAHFFHSWTHQTNNATDGATEENPQQTSLTIDNSQTASLKVIRSDRKQFQIVSAMQVASKHQLKSWHKCENLLQPCRPVFLTTCHSLLGGHCNGAQMVQHSNPAVGVVPLTGSDH